MLGYIIFTMSITLLVLLKNFQKGFNRFFELSILALSIIFSGLRYNVGWDYEAYWLLIQKGQYDRFELIPRFLADIAHVLGKPYVFFLLTSVWINLFFYIGTKKFVNRSILPFVLYLFYPFLYLNSFSIVRQLMAVSVFLLSIYYLFFERKIISSFMYAFLSFLCHESALYAAVLSLLTFLLLERKKEKKLVFSFELASISFWFIFLVFLGLTYLFKTQLTLFLVTLLRFFGVKYVLYTSEYITQGGQKSIYLNILMVSFSVILSVVVKSKSTKLLRINTLLLIAVILEFLFSSFGHIGLRYSIYFYSLLPISSYLITDVKRKEQKLTLGIIIFIIFLASFYVLVYIDWNAFLHGKNVKSQFIPYRSIFEMLYTE